jgi:cellobiose phosphorylase
VRENAAQYNHSALWFAQALILFGFPEKALKIINAVNPLARSFDDSSASVYRGEPYVIAAEVYGSPTFPGRSGWTWYSASSGVFYRTITEYLLGIHKEGNRMTVNPVLPDSWNNAGAEYIFGSSKYIISMKREQEAKEVSVFIDGLSAGKDGFELKDDGKEHRVDVTLPLTVSVDSDVE